MDAPTISTPIRGSPMTPPPPSFAPAQRPLWMLAKLHVIMNTSADPQHTIPLLKPVDSGVARPSPCPTQARNLLTSTSMPTHRLPPAELGVLLLNDLWWPWCVKSQLYKLNSPKNLFMLIISQTSTLIPLLTRTSVYTL